MTGQTYMNGSIVNVTKGNTHYCAEFVNKAVGGDMFQIVPDKDYPVDHMQFIDVAKAELRNGEMVGVKNPPESIAQYDTVFLCYPNWWNAIPMAVATFLSRYDFSGKRIVPLCTNEGSGLGGTVASIKKYARGATVEQGLSVHGAEAKNSERLVADWARRFA